MPSHTIKLTSFMDAYGVIICEGDILQHIILGNLNLVMWNDRKMKYTVPRMYWIYKIFGNIHKDPDILKLLRYHKIKNLNMSIK